MAHKGLPRAEALILTKAELLRSLVQVDSKEDSSSRALAMDRTARHCLRRLPLACPGVLLHRRLFQGFPAGAHPRHPGQPPQ